jgi:hypothetical protein
MQKTKWQVGILPTGDCFLSFNNGEKKFELTCDEDTCIEMGKALVETGTLRKTGHIPNTSDLTPKLIPMKPGRS